MSETSPETKEKPSLPAPGLAVTDQTLLVGEHVYIRAVEEEHADYGMSWRGTHYPQSPERVKSWINDDMKKERDSRRLLIIRKEGDRPVGSVYITSWAHNHFLTSFSDPLYGERGHAWEGEALALIVPWLVDEQHRVIARVEDVPEEKVAVIDALERIGCRETVRFHEKLRRGAGWQDALTFDYPNKAWMVTIGDPHDYPLERSGTGEPRPVSPTVRLTGAVPKNAMKVGERFYLRPMQNSDMALNAEWRRRETEVVWSGGRFLQTTTSGESWLKNLQGEEPQEWIRFTVCLRENDMPIGFVGLDGIDYQHRHAESESELFRPDYRGDGYGSEAKHLMFDYGFNDLGLHSIQSWVFFKNPRSAAALRKQGYSEVGREHWLVQHNGKYENFVVFELLAETWRTMPRRTIGTGKDA